MKHQQETTQTTSTLKSASQSKSTLTSISTRTTKTTKTTTTSKSTSKSTSNSSSVSTITKTTDSTPNKEKVAKDQKNRVDSDIAINNFGLNLNLKVNQTKFRNVPKNSLKNILFWNEALPLKLFGLIFVAELIYYM